MDTPLASLLPQAGDCDLDLDAVGSMDPFDGDLGPLDLGTTSVDGSSLSIPDQDIWHGTFEEEFSFDSKNAQPAVSAAPVALAGAVSCNRRPDLNELLDGSVADPSATHGNELLDMIDEKASLNAIRTDAQATDINAQPLQENMHPQANSNPATSAHTSPASSNPMAVESAEKGKLKVSNTDAAAASKLKDKSVQRKLRNKESARRYREKQVAKRRQLEDYTRSLAEQNRELESLHQRLLSLTCER